MCAPTYGVANIRSLVLSLDINKVLPTLIARTVYEIPYCYGNVTHKKVESTVTTTVTRKWPKSAATSEIIVEETTNRW